MIGVLTHSKCWGNWKQSLLSVIISWTQMSPPRPEWNLKWWDSHWHWSNHSNEITGWHNLGQCTCTFARRGSRRRASADLDAAIWFSFRDEGVTTGNVCARVSAKSEIPRKSVRNANQTISGPRQLQIIQPRSTRTCWFGPQVDSFDGVLSVLLPLSSASRFHALIVRKPTVVVFADFSGILNLERFDR